MHIPVVAADWLSGRERELWTPLVSVATWLGIGKAGIEALQRASVDLGQLKTLPPMVWHSAQDEKDAEERDAAERVLTDLRACIRPGEVVIPSSEAVTRLRSITVAPWRSWRGVGINEITLAALLARYGLKPDVVQIGKGRKERKQLRGYVVKALQEAKP